MKLTFRYLRCVVISFAWAVLGCDRIELGDDPFAVADAGRADAPAPDGAIPMVVRGPLDADFFFCRVQPLVVRPSRCATERGCHATDSAMRLLVDAESVAPPSCVGDHPTSPVPASYYTNFARARAETRGTARASDFYWRPLGNDHPERMYLESLDRSGDRSRVDRRDGAVTSGLKLAWLVLVLASAGCVTVRPYQRELLSDSSMTFGDDPLEPNTDHARAYREGAGGEGAVGGGGCGCN